MKKSNIIIIAVIAIVAIWAISGYNGMVNKEETVSNAWANVEAAYQRRADLIPQLVNTVKGYANHEKTTLDAVVSARTKATQMTVDVGELTEENIQKYQEAQGEVGAAIGRLLAITESYPELKANENFSELQAQLEGTENRINEVRKNYNASVKEYNVSVRKFPNNILAGMFGFERKAEFKAEEGASKAPEVNF
ncbi:MAG: LemA family protein [Bacteroidaceae bacterium]|jgi:LemA protein|nr:LemA family protein [Bacteroidaceae bacterium]